MADGKVKIKTELDEQSVEKETSKLKKTLSTVGKATKAAAVATAAGVAAVGAAMVKVGKDALNAYADYEQLAGGVETLFKDSADTVMNYAEKAYMTAGLSANQYMEQATSFSARLIRDTGGDTEKTAQLVDMAITDMADNANKMGTSIELIQNAYEGLSKGNATMVDNLKVGYGGTQTEMLKLAKDMGVVDESIQSFNDLSFEDSILAIHKLQEELGITGTTLEEAQRTIQGSMTATKAAWDNLLVGIASDDADVGALIDNLMTALFGEGDGESGLANQILPRIETIADGLIEAIDLILPVLSEQGLSLIESLATGIVESLPALAETAVDILLGLVEFLVAPETIETLLTAGLAIIMGLMNGLTEALPELIPAITAAVLMIVETLTEPEQLEALINAAIALIWALIEGIWNALPDLLIAVVLLLANVGVVIGDYLDDMLQWGKKLIEKLKDGIQEKIATVKQNILDLMQSIKDTIQEKIDAAKNWGKDLLQNFIDGITAKIQALKEKVSSVASVVKDFLGFSEPETGPLSNFHTYAPDMIDLFVKGMNDNKYKLVNATEGLADVISTVADVGMWNTSYEPNYSERVITNNNNTVQTVRIIPQKDGLFELVQEQEHIRGKEI